MTLVSTHRDAPRQSAARRRAQALLDATIALPRRGGLREHDDGACRRARRRLARRAPAPLPDAQRAGRRGGRAPARRAAPRSSWRPPTRCRPGPSASTAGARPAVAQLHAARSSRARWTCGRTAAPTPSCAGTSSRSSATSTARRCELARRLFPQAAERPDFEHLIELAAVDDPRARRCSTRCTPAASAAGRQWPFCRARLAALLEESE